MIRNAVATIAFVAVAALVASSVHALEYMPYPGARITEGQWQAYFDQVRKAHGDSKREFPAEHLVVYEDRRGGMFWAFTTPTHPAHPAWVTRQIVADQSGQTKVNQIGYFAGQEKPFAKLFHDYLNLTEQTVKNTPKGKEGAKQPISPELTFKEAEKLVQRSRRMPGYEEYINEFVQYNNRLKLDERTGCALLATGEVRLILVLTDKSIIESAVTDVDTAKAVCIRRNYLNVSVKKPPHSPFAFQMIMR